MSTLVPRRIRMVDSGRSLVIEYVCQSYRLPASWLRLRSPSAEHRAAWIDWERLSQQKQAIRLIEVVAVGHYALRLTFDDGHNTGLYTWCYIMELCAMYRDGVYAGRDNQGDVSRCQELEK